VNYQVSIDTTKDTHVRDYNADYMSRNYGIYNRLLVGYYNGYGYSHQRALVEFDLSSIPSTAVINSVVVSLYQDVGAAHASSDQDHIVHVYRITSGWVEGDQNGAAGSVCWNDQPTINTSSLASMSIVGVGGGTWRDFSGSALTSVVQDWVDGTYSNYGLMIMNDVGNENDDGAHKFYSDDQGSSPPKIWVDYTVYPTATPTDTPTDTPSSTPTFTPSNTPTDSPTATPTQYTSHDTTIYTTKDTHIRDYNSNYQGRNYGVYNRLLIGYYAGYGYGHQRAMVEYDLSSIPSNATVTGAVLSLYQDVGSSHSNSNQDHALHVYRITSGWDEGTKNGAPGSVCWNDQPAKDNTSLASMSINGVGGGTWRDFSNSALTSVVQGWVSGSYTNYGVMIMNDVGNENDDGAHKFYSDNQGSSPPQIWISYTVPVP